MFKSKIINKTLVIFTLVLSQTALAANVWVEGKTVDKIQVMGSGNAVIYLNEIVDATCQGGGKLFHVYENSNGMTARGLDHIISAVLTAQASKRQIFLQYDNANSSCFVRNLLVD